MVLFVVPNRFYERGHRVIGVEFVEEAARSFFENNDLPFETTLSEDPQCAVLQVSTWPRCMKRMKLIKHLCKDILLWNTRFVNGKMLTTYKNGQKKYNIFRNCWLHKGQF